MKKLVLSTVLLLAVLISACAPQAAQTPVATELPEPTEGAQADSHPRTDACTERYC